MFSNLGSHTGQQYQLQVIFNELKFVWNLEAVNK